MQVHATSEKVDGEVQWQQAGDHAGCGPKDQCAFGRKSGPLADAFDGTRNLWSEILTVFVPKFVLNQVYSQRVQCVTTPITSRATPSHSLISTVLHNSLHSLSATA